MTTPPGGLPLQTPSGGHHRARRPSRGRRLPRIIPFEAATDATRDTIGPRSPGQVIRAAEAPAPQDPGMTRPPSAAARRAHDLVRPANAEDPLPGPKGQHLASSYRPRGRLYSAGARFKIEKGGDLEQGRMNGRELSADQGTASRAGGSAQTRRHRQPAVHGCRVVAARTASRGATCARVRGVACRIRALATMGM